MAFFYPQPRLVFTETIGPRQTGLAQGPDLRVLKIGFLSSRWSRLGLDYFREFHNSNASSIKPLGLGWVA